MVFRFNFRRRILLFRSTLSEENLTFSAHSIMLFLAVHVIPLAGIFFEHNTTFFVVPKFHRLTLGPVGVRHFSIVDCTFLSTQAFLDSDPKIVFGKCLEQELILFIRAYYCQICTFTLTYKSCVAPRSRSWEFTVAVFTKSDPTFLASC